QRMGHRRGRRDRARRRRPGDRLRRRATALQEAEVPEWTFPGRRRMTKLRAASHDAIQEAAEILRAGGLVAFPTETVYGLGGDATHGESVARVYAAKGRPTFNPLIVHVARPRWVAGLAEPDGRFDKLARRFWPGPLTM